MRHLAPECHKIRDDVMRRDDLSAVRRAEVDLHLNRCDACREITGRFEVIEAGLPAEEPLSDDVTDRIYRRLIPVVHELAQENREERHLHWQRPLRLAGALAAAACLVVAVGLFVHFNRLGSDAGVETPRGDSPVAVRTEAMVLPGLINRVEGAVSLDGQLIEPAQELAFQAGTSVETTDGARFQYLIDNRFHVLLKGNSRWSLTSVSDRYMAMELGAGELAVRFEGGNGQVLEVKTPDAIVRVVGTIFALQVGPDGGTKVGVTEGVVRVFPRQESGSWLDVTAGDSVAVPGVGQLEPLSNGIKALAYDMAGSFEYSAEQSRLVRFAGSPEQVMLEIDGRVVGSTPLTVRLPQTPLSYRLSAPGLQSKEGSVLPDGGTEVTYELAPADALPDPQRTRRQVRRRTGAKRRAADTDTGVWNDYDRARSAMVAGDVPYAIGLLERAVKRDGVSHKELISELTLLAQCHGAVGQYEKATGIYERIVAERPASTEAQNARYEMGRLAMDQLGDFSRARAAFTAYLASPRGGALREDAYYSLCELDGRSGALQNSLHCFGEFLQAFPLGHRQLDARLWHGALLQDVERKWAPAEELLLSVVQAKPRHPRAEEVRYRVALGRYQQNDYKGALRMIATYLDHHPTGLYQERVKRLRAAILKQAPPVR